MKHLQKAASEIIQSNTANEKHEQLSRAFEMFSLETSRLEMAYASLKAQFKGLDLKLQETNRKLYEKVSELDMVTEYLKSVLNNINQGILFIDLNGSVMTCNHAAEVILGIEQDAILLENFWDNFPDRAFGFSLRESLKNLKVPGSVYAEYNGRNGQHNELEVSTTLVHSATPIAGRQGKGPLSKGPPVLGILIMLKDVTDIRRLQLMAHRSDRMKELGNMAAQVAHEIRNPLGGIKGFASLLERDLSSQPKLQEMARYIVEGTDSLNRLVTQVLDYARPCQPHFEKVDLLTVLNDVKQHIFADESNNKTDLEISIESPIENTWVVVDRQMFKSAILNLIVNAIQAMPKGGKISLSAKQRRKDTVLSLSDTGVGISKENISKLFSPFFTTKLKGNGFGLAEVHKIIQAHEGTIEVSSEIGKGSTFVIKLPIKTN